MFLHVLHYTFCPQVGASHCYEVLYVLCLLYVLQLKRVRRATWGV